MSPRGGPIVAAGDTEAQKGPTRRAPTPPKSALGRPQIFPQICPKRSSGYGSLSTAALRILRQVSGGRRAIALDPYTVRTLTRYVAKIDDEAAATDDLCRMSSSQWVRRGS